jgi:hypothetical protein
MAKKKRSSRRLRDTTTTNASVVPHNNRNVNALPERPGGGPSDGRNAHPVASRRRAYVAVSMRHYTRDTTPAPTAQAHHSPWRSETSKIAMRTISDPITYLLKYLSICHLRPGLFVSSAFTAPPISRMLPRGIDRWQPQYPRMPYQKIFNRFPRSYDPIQRR